jgi:hypothetical protein
MRVEVGKAIRVGPGDEVVVRGRLPANSRLGRLYVFVREGDAPFAPYVENIVSKLAVVGERPHMYSPMGMRLDDNRRQREISFVADFDGWVRVMQEVDRPADVRAVIKISRTINPHLPWTERFKRLLKGIQLPWTWFSRTAAR